MLELFWTSDIVTLAIFFGVAFVLLAGLVSYGVVRFARRHVTPLVILTDGGSFSEAALHEAEEIRIVFDGFPGTRGCQFVEVEDRHGHSIRAGAWHSRRDGLVELRLRIAGEFVGTLTPAPFRS